MKHQKETKPLIYQDQDALNSVRVVLAGAEKTALINVERPQLKEERVEERKTAAIISGGTSGVATLVILMAVGALTATTNPTSGSGIVSALSHLGKLIGGVIGNNMLSGIFLLVLLPAIVGFGVFAFVFNRIEARQYAAFLAEKAALQERARACRTELKKQLPKTDTRWQPQLQEQIVLLDSVISNLTSDIEIKTTK